MAAARAAYPGTCRRSAERPIGRGTLPCGRPQRRPRIHGRRRPRTSRRGLDHGVALGRARREDALSNLQRFNLVDRQRHRVVGCVQREQTAVGHRRPSRPCPLCRAPRPRFRAPPVPCPRSWEMLCRPLLSGVKPRRARRGLRRWERPSSPGDPCSGKLQFAMSTLPPRMLPDDHIFVDDVKKSFRIDSGDPRHHDAPSAEGDGRDHRGLGCGQDDVAADAHRSRKAYLRSYLGGHRGYGEPFPRPS